MELTIVIYISAVIAGRRTLYRTFSSMMWWSKCDVMYLIPNMNLFMRRYAIAQHRIFLVVLIVTASFMCTSFLAELLNVILKYKSSTDFVNVAEPFYVFVFVFNNADTVLINFWRDWIFQEKLKELFSCNRVDQSTGGAHHASHELAV